MAVVLVNRPTVEGGCVYFSWTASEPLDNVRDSKFFVEYVDRNVEALPLWVHVSTAIALLTARLAELPGRHVLVVEGTVPHWVVNLWGTYHAATNVSIIAEKFDEAEERALPSRTSNPHFGLLFGGGKDSLLALDLVRESFPEAAISLISFSLPAAHVKMAELERRRDSFALRGSAERYGARIIRVRTDARSVFDKFFFHTELYTATILPILFLTDMSAVTFSYEYCHYWTNFADGRRELNFRKSRPEYCRAISNAYSHAIGRTVDVFNANAFVSELSSFLYLARKRPTFASEVMMCESVADPKVKWCGNCTKCMEYSFFSALADPDNSELPAGDFLASSPWITKVMPEVLRRMAAYAGEPAQRWFPALTFAGHIDTFSHVIRKLNENPPGKLDETARRNLAILADAYARPGLDAEEVAYEDVLRRTWPSELQDRVLTVIRSNIQTGPAPRQKMWGSTSVVFEPEVHDDLPDQYVAPFGIASHASEIVAMGAKFDDRRIVLDESADTLDVTPLGGFRREDLRIARCSRWVDIHSSVSAPKRGDGFAVSGRFTKPDKVASSELSLRVSSPYFGSHVGRLALRVQVGATVVVDTDLSDFGGAFFVTAPATDDSVYLDIQVAALRDCENWGWGSAMRICIEVLGWQTIRASRGVGPRHTYPAATATSAHPVEPDR